MTEKRFRVQEHCLMSSYGIEAENWLVTNDNHSVVLNDKAEAHMVANMGNDVINKLNNLYEENQQLQSRINDYDVALKTLQDLCERKLKENEQLKQNCKNYNWYKEYKRLLNENEQLKQYKDAVLNCDSSKIIRVNRNTGEVDLIDKEYSNES